MQAQQTLLDVGAAAFGTWVALKGAWCRAHEVVVQALAMLMQPTAEAYIELCPQVSLKGASRLQLLLQVRVLGLHTSRRSDLAHQEAASIK